MILVTGGNGLVGSHLLYNLCKLGKTVRAIKRPLSNITNVKRVFSYYTENSNELLNEIEWIDADLLDMYSLMDAMKGITEIYHCAAIVSFDAKHQKEMMLTNIEGTANMVNAAMSNSVKKFCHVSSIASIGRPNNVKTLSEEYFWKSSPEHSMYSISKYCAEREVWRASEEGLNIIIVNPSLIIGPGNWNQTSSNMFNKAFKGLKFYTNGLTGFIDVRDVATLMIKLLNSDKVNERYILSSDNWKYKDLFELIQKEFNKPVPSIRAGKFLSECAWRIEYYSHFITGTKPLLTKETARSAHNVTYFSNNKIKKIFPDFVFIPIEKSIKDTCKLYLRDKIKE